MIRLMISIFEHMYLLINFSIFLTMTISEELYVFVKFTL